MDSTSLQKRIAVGPKARLVADAVSMASKALLLLVLTHYLLLPNDFWLLFFAIPVLAIAGLCADLSIAKSIARYVSESMETDKSQVRHIVRVGLVYNLATVFPSPFIYKQTQHVTEPQMNSYATVFDVNDEALPLACIRQAPWRYADAINGVATSRRYSTAVSNENLTRLGSFFEGCEYLAVSDYDYQCEVGGYRELCYTDQAFDSLDAQPGVNQVVSNEAVNPYHVPEGGR